MKRLFCLGIAAALVCCSPAKKIEAPNSAIAAVPTEPSTYDFTATQAIDRMKKGDPSISTAVRLACTPNTPGADGCIRMQTNEGQIDIETYKSKAVFLSYKVIDERTNMHIRNFKPTESMMAVFENQPYTTVDRARIHREVDDYATITPGFRETEKVGAENRRWIAMDIWPVELIFNGDGYTLYAAPLNDPAQGLGS